MIAPCRGTLRVLLATAALAALVGAAAANAGEPPPFESDRNFSKLVFPGDDGRLVYRPLFGALGEQDRARERGRARLRGLWVGA